MGARAGRSLTRRSSTPNKAGIKCWTRNRTRLRRPPPQPPRPPPPSPTRARTTRRRRDAEPEMEQNIVLDDLGGMSLSDAIDATIVEFDDGDLVHGKVVKIDADEVLLDIGYKSEGVIPSKELSIRNDVDPNEVVSLGEEIEALVLQKEDKDGRLILSKKRAQYERGVGHDRAEEGERGSRLRARSSRSSRAASSSTSACAASCPHRSSTCGACATCIRTSAACSSARSSSSTRTATTSCCRAARTSKRPSASSATSSSRT